VKMMQFQRMADALGPIYTLFHVSTFSPFTSNGVQVIAKLVWTLRFVQMEGR
jgi:hypothetical protein